jgi:hypothetical protein
MPGTDNPVFNIMKSFIPVLRRRIGAGAEPSALSIRFSHQWTDYGWG